MRQHQFNIGQALSQALSDMLGLDGLLRRHPQQCECVVTLAVTPHLHRNM